MSRQPATTLGCPPLPRSGGRDGCTSVVEAERSRTAQRGFADPRVDRDVAARLSEGPVPAAQRCGEIERAAPSEVPGVLSRRHRHAGAETMRPAPRRNVSNQADSYRANAPALRCRSRSLDRTGTCSRIIKPRCQGAVPHCTWPPAAAQVQGLNCEWIRRSARRGCLLGLKLG